MGPQAETLSGRIEDGAVKIMRSNPDHAMQVGRMTLAYSDLCISLSMVATECNRLCGVLRGG